jgi:hypothetical protein
MLAVQFGIVGPLLLSAATEPARSRAGEHMPPVSREAVVEYVTRATLAALTTDSPTARRTL